MSDDFEDGMQAAAYIADARVNIAKARLDTVTAERDATLAKIETAALRCLDVISSLHESDDPADVAVCAEARVMHGMLKGGVK